MPLAAAAVRRFLQDEQAQDINEYAMVVAAVCLVLIAAVGTFSQEVASCFRSITEKITGVGTPNPPPTG